MAVTIDGAGPIAGLTSIASPTTLNGLTIPTTGFGKILQVVQGSTSTSVSTTSTSYVTTGLSAAITPSSASSKVLIISNTTTYASVQVLYFSVCRGTVEGTNLSSAGSMAKFNSNAGLLIAPGSTTYLDIPGTTSSLTYTVGFKVGAGSGIVQPSSDVLSTITLMEVGA